MPNPTQLAIDTLKADPTLSGRFDEMFGEGASAQFTASPAQPGNSPQIGKDDNPGLVDTVLDVAKAIPGGVVDSFQAAGDLAAEIADKAGLPAGIRFDDDGISFVNKEELDSPIFGKIGEDDAILNGSSTAAGQITRGISQFVTSFVGAGKVLAPLKTATVGKGVATQVGVGATQGAVADFIGFGGSEDRLTDLMLSTPNMRDFVPDFLARDDDDTELDGRFKNALEGVIIGAAVEPVFHMFKAIRKARRAFKEGGEEAARKVVQENAQVIDEAERILSNSTDGNVAASSGAVKSPDLIGVKAAERMVESARVANHNRPAVDVEGVKKALLEGGGKLDLDDHKLTQMFNTEKLDTPDDIKAILQHTADAYEDHIGSLITRGTLTHAQALKNAATEMDDLLGQGGMDQLLAVVGRQAETVEKQVAYLVGGKQLMQSMAREIEELVTKIDGGVNVIPEDEARLLNKIQQLGDLESSIKAIQTSAARVTSAGRIVTRDRVTGKAIDAAELMINLRQGGDVKKIVKTLRAAKGNPVGMLQLTRKIRKGGVAAVTREFFINSILSGPKTHIVNMSSNLINTAFLPIEKSLGGLVGGDLKSAEEGARQFIYATTGWVEFIRAIKQADTLSDIPSGGRAVYDTFKSGRNVLDPSITKIEGSGDVITSRSTGIGGEAVRFLGNAVRLPTRLLSTEDELFKQINYRAALKARLHTQARHMGLKGGNRAAWVEHNFKNGFDQAGRGINQEALQAAREATFTQPLRQGSFSQKAQGAVGAIPGGMGTFVAPFIRTPSNIIAAVGLRTPGLNLFSKQFREDLAAGGVRRANAIGKAAAGLGLYIPALYAATIGRITGGGPSDAVKRRHKMATGWQPYSFVSTDENGVTTYTSYKRLDPYGMFFGLAADFVDVAQHIEEQNRTEIAAAMGIAVAKNLTSKTYLQGITNALDALSQPERKFNRWISNTVSGFAPSGLKQISEWAGLTNDPVMRETRNWMDGFINKIPGLSQSLPPKRSWVTGDVIPYSEGRFLPDSISPYATSKSKDNLVLDELSRLDHGWSAPMRNIHGVDLSELQYDRLLELSGTIKIGGRTLMERLERSFTKERYDLNRDHIPDHEGSYRHGTVDRWVKKYREKAKRYLLKEEPALKELVKVNRRALRRAGSSNPERAKSGLEALIK